MLCVCLQLWYTFKNKDSKRWFTAMTYKLYFCFPKEQISKEFLKNHRNVRNVLQIKWKNLLFSGKLMWMYRIYTSYSCNFNCLLMTAVLPSSWGPLCWWRSWSGWSTQTEWTPQTSISCTGKNSCPAACSVSEVWRWWQSRYKLAVDEIKAHLSKHEVLMNVYKHTATHHPDLSMFDYQNSIDIPRAL